MACPDKQPSTVLVCASHAKGWQVTKPSSDQSHQGRASSPGRVGPALQRGGRPREPRLLSQRRVLPLHLPGKSHTVQCAIQRCPARHNHCKPSAIGGAQPAVDHASHLSALGAEGVGAAKPVCPLPSGSTLVSALLGTRIAQQAATAVVA